MGILQRGATVAGMLAAMLVGGTGVALGATTHELPRPAVPVAAPHPMPQLPPTPVTPLVVQTVKSVRSLTRPTQEPPTSPTPKHPVVKPAAKPQRTVTVDHPARHATHAVSWQPNVSPEKAAPSSTSVAAHDAAHDAVFVQRTAPIASGPLAGLPAPVRHTLPTALVVVAAAMLAALAAGHLGVWRARRN